MVYFFFYSQPQNVSSFDWSNFWTAVASMVTLFALASTWWFYFRDKRKQESLFYLQKIESYYSEVTTFFDAKDNNNLKWHYAIESLKMAESLQGSLKEKSHQNICVMDIVSAGFRIRSILGQIDDFRFFYGLSDYKNIDTNLLYLKSHPESLESPCARISPKALLVLCAFLDKVNRIYYDSNFNKTPYHQIFNSDYFKSSIDSIKITELTGFTEIGLKVIFDYIKDFEVHESERKASRNKTAVENEKL